MNDRTNTAENKSAQAVEPVDIHLVIHQVWIEETSSWADVTPMYYAERQPSNRRRVYYAPQPPVQTDVRVWLTDERRELHPTIVDALEARSGLACAIAAVNYALTAEEGMTWLSLWREGRFDACRDEWPDAPDGCYPEPEAVNSNTNSNFEVGDRVGSAQ